MPRPPPSSRLSFLKWGAAAAATRAPVAVPPVKDRPRTPGCSTRGWPTSGPKPWTTLKAPGGPPTSVKIRARAVAVDGVSSLGLATIALPMASAGAAFQVSR